MLRAQLQALFIVVAMLLGTGCRAGDSTAPAAPRLDLSTVRTSRGSLLVTGAGEAGAQLVVTRLPLLSAPFAAGRVGGDARFAVEVPLAPLVRNRILVSTVDAGGRGSPAAELVVDQVVAEPLAPTLSLSQSQVRVGADGTAPLVAHAVVRSDDGLPAAGRAVLLQVDGEVGARSLTLLTGPDGAVSTRIPGLQRPGAGTVVARLVGTGLSSEPQPFLVRAGLPVSARLLLKTAAAAESTSSLTVSVLEDVEAIVTALDAAGNAIEAPFELTATPSEGVLVAGGRVLPISQGTFTLSARLVDVPGITASATLTASPRVTPSGRLRLAVQFPASVVSGAAAPYRLWWVDQRGTALEAPATALALTDARGTFSVVSKSVTLVTAGPQSVTFEATAPDGQRSSMTISTLVRPGPPASVAVQLGGLFAPLSAPRAMAPGETLALSIVVGDAAGNGLRDAPVAIDPGALLLTGADVTAPARRGTHALSVSVPGTGVRGVAVVSVSAPAVAIEASCPARAIAGLPFDCSATLRDASGQAVDAGSVRWSTTPATGVSLSGGSITPTLSGRLTVRAADGSGNLVAERTVEVAAGPPASLRLALSPSTVAVGEAVSVSATVVDGFGNDVPSSIALSTDAPGAQLSAGRLTNLSRTGSWHVAGTATPASGAPQQVSAMVSLTVTSGPARRLALALSTGHAESGSPVAVTTTLFDAGGNPLAASAALRVDGRAPDGVDVRFESNLLSVRTPGPHVVSATADGLSAEAVLDILAAPDREAPSISLEADRPGPYRSGESVALTVRVRDDRALSGVRVMAYGAAFETLLDEFLPLRGASSASRTVSVTLPAGRVGALTALASASDAASHTADADPLTIEVDDHAGTFTLPAGVSVRSVSVDPELRSPGALAFSGGSLFLLSTGAASTDMRRVEANGRVTRVDDLDGFSEQAGLAASAGGSRFVLARQAPGVSDAVTLLRQRSDAGLQSYSTPPLATGATLHRPAGVSADRKSLSPRLYAADAALSAATVPQGHLWSLPLSDALGAFGVDAAQVREATLADIAPAALCVRDTATPSELYFTGHKAGAGAALAGLYTVALTGTGEVPVGAATPTALYETPRAVPGGTLVHGPCVHEGADAGRVTFATWVVDGAGVASSGRIVACSVGGCTEASLEGLVTASSGGSLGIIGGLASDGLGLVAAEKDGRLFRIDGLF